MQIVRPYVRSTGRILCDAVTLQVEAHGDAAEDLRDAERSSDLFEKEFHVQLYFRSQNHR